MHSTFGKEDIHQSALKMLLHSKQDHLKPTYLPGTDWLPNGPAPTSGLWADAALSAMITHNDSASIAACVSFVHMLWDLLKLDDHPAPEWWSETYVRIARELESDETYTARGGAWGDYEGPVWKFVEERVCEAYEKGLSVVEAGRLWYSGAYLLETVPSVIFILMRHGHAAEEAIVRAVNDTKDNDTIGAIVGAAVGALHGKENIPRRWIRDLSGRTTDCDDGEIFRLLREARRIWWE